MKTVVSLCGHAHAGKDAFASTLIEAGFIHIKFASPLKDAMLCLFPHMDARHVDGELKDVVDPVTGSTPRALLQVIGTDLLQHGLGALLQSSRRSDGASSQRRPWNVSVHAITMLS